MTESNNNFEEYEFDDDLDDPWDDVIDDEIPHEDNVDVETKEKHQGSSRTKSKSILKPILSLALLGGISFAAYSSFMPFPEKNQIPIIKINKTPVAEITRTDDADLNTAPTETTRTQSQLNSDIPLQTEGAQITHGKNTILTPMPDNAVNNTVTLPQLTIAPDAIEPEAASTKVAIEGNPKVLSEEELLSKTESVYVKMPESEAINEDSATELPIPPAPKEEKIEKIVVEESKAPPPPPKEIVKNPAKMANNVYKKPAKKPDVPQQKAAWTVRAAQSGRAVIYDKNSKKMKSVEVNDILPGIGRIKSIQLKNGRWAIIGTKGKILQ